MSNSRRKSSSPNALSSAIANSEFLIEQAVAWLTCSEEMFGRFKQVRVMGNDEALVGLDLRYHNVVAECDKGKRKARVPLDAIEFPDLATVEHDAAVTSQTNQTRPSGRSRRR